MSLGVDSIVPMCYSISQNPWRIGLMVSLHYNFGVRGIRYGTSAPFGVLDSRPWKFKAAFREVICLERSYPLSNLKNFQSRPQFWTCKNFWLEVMVTCDSIYFYNSCFFAHLLWKKRYYTNAFKSIYLATISSIFLISVTWYT